MVPESAFRGFGTALDSSASGSGEDCGRGSKKIDTFQEWETETMLLGLLIFQK